VWIILLVKENHKQKKISNTTKEELTGQIHIISLDALRRKSKNSYPTMIHLQSKMN
jgi:hypothetical protein